MNEYRITLAQELELKEQFSYHAPFGDQGERYSAIREAGRVFAETLYRLCPPSAERTLARRDIEMAVMRANQSIAVNEIPS